VFLNASDFVNGTLGRYLDRHNLTGNHFGCFGGLHCKRFHLGSNDGKAPSGLAGPRCLNGCVEGEQVRLPGNLLGFMQGPKRWPAGLGCPPLGQERTFSDAEAMSALPSIADIRG
jgi:hypothetical protein